MSVRTAATAAVLTLATSAGAVSLTVTAAAAPGPKVSTTQCRIDFQASSLDLRVGQDLVLTWTATGADALTASWTTAPVPFVGTATTTMNAPGRYSYQVTGTSGGRYCGGAGVQVTFTADTMTSGSGSATTDPVSASTTTSSTAPSSTAPSSTAPSSTAPSSTAPSSTGASNGMTTSGTTVATTGAAGTSAGTLGAGLPPQPRYPTQSPTGGTGVPWFARPVDLAALGALLLLCAALVWKRDTVRGALVHRH